MCPSPQLPHRCFSVGAGHPARPCFVYPSKPYGPPGRAAPAYPNETAGERRLLLEGKAVGRGKLLPYVVYRGCGVARTGGRVWDPPLRGRSKVHRTHERPPCVKGAAERMRGWGIVNPSTLSGHLPQGELPQSGKRGWPGPLHKGGFFTPPVGADIIRPHCSQNPSGAPVGVDVLIDPIWAPHPSPAAQKAGRAVCPPRFRVA